jgi:hypothetical protein
MDSGSNGAEGVSGALGMLSKSLPQTLAVKENPVSIGQ